MLERHVNSQIKDPTEDQLKVYYEGVDTDQSFEAMRDKIVERIRQLRLAKARTTYLESLRRDMGVTIVLAPPSLGPKCPSTMRRCEVRGTLRFS